MVADGSFLRLYVDGIQRAQTTQTITPTATNTPLSISEGGYSLDGEIDDVRVYNYARTPAQIAWDYNKGAPIAHFKFDECQGTVVHSSTGVGQTGTIVVGASGTQTIIGTCQTTGTAWGNGASGKTNSSLNFDGTDDQVDFSTIGQMGTNDFSVGTWVKGNSPAANSGIFSRGLWGANRSKGYGLLTALAGSNRFEFEVGGITLTSTATIDSNWHHVIGVRKGTTLSIYIDGTLNKETTTAVVDLNQSFNLHLGQRGVNVGFFNGQIDDVRIYNYALTPEQVKILYNNGGFTIN